MAEHRERQIIKNKTAHRTDARFSVRRFVIKALALSMRGGWGKSASIIAQAEQIIGGNAEKFAQLADRLRVQV